MAVPERLPIANRSRKVLSQVMTRGVLYDLAAHSLTRDIAKYSTDFMGSTIDANLVAAGNGTGAAMVTTGESGAIQMVTGAVDNQTSSIYLAGGNFVGNQNPVISCRIKVDSIATGNVQFGFCDNIAATVLTTTALGPFVSPLANTPTLVSTTVDAVALTYDLSGTVTGSKSAWRLAYSRGSTAAQVLGSSTAATIVAPTAGTYQWLTIALQRLDLATDQMAVKAYVNGVQVAFVNTGVISNTAPLYPFLVIGATSGASRTLTCDFFEVYQDRDTSA